MLKKLDKGQTTDISFESNEGELELLSSNKGGQGSPSLDLDFSQEEINSFIAFAEICKRVHSRLIMEGFTIKDEQISKNNDTTIQKCTTK